MRTDPRPVDVSLKTGTFARMTYYADLSPYRYCTTEDGALNVGWLARGSDFPTGEVPPEFTDRLSDYLDLVVNQTRGLQDCHFCEDGLAYRAEGHMGSAEIRVFAPDGTIYASPTLIIHYIKVHRYRPPQAFIDAVLASPPPPDPGYIARLEASGAEFVNWKALREKYPGEF